MKPSSQGGTGFWAQKGTGPTSRTPAPQRSTVAHLIGPGLLLVMVDRHTETLRDHCSPEPNYKYPVSSFKRSSLSCHPLGLKMNACQA